MRSRPELTSALLVAVTGYGQREDRERAVAAGFDAYLLKPVDIATLQSCLEELLAARLDVGTRDMEMDEALGLNCAWYAGILLTLTDS